MGPVVLWDPRERGSGSGARAGERHQQAGQRHLDELANLVPNLPEAVQRRLFVRRLGGQLGRIREGHVDDPSGAREGGAVLVRVAADRDHQVELRGRQLADGLGFLRGQVHVHLGHHLHRAGIHAVRFNSRGVGAEVVAVQCQGEAFGHLAPAGVAGAEKEHARDPIVRHGGWRRGAE